MNDASLLERHRRIESQVVGLATDDHHVADDDCIEPQKPEVTYSRLNQTQKVLLVDSDQASENDYDEARENAPIV